MSTGELSLADVVRKSEPDADDAAVEAAVKRLRRRLLAAEEIDDATYMWPPPDQRAAGRRLTTTEDDLRAALRRRDWQRELRERRDEERDEQLASNTTGIRATAQALVAIADQLDAHGVQLGDHECRLCRLEGKPIASPHECQPIPTRRARKPGPKARAEAMRLIAAGASRRAVARMMGMPWMTFKRMLGRGPLTCPQSRDIPNEVA